MRKIALLDLSTYPVTLDHEYRSILRERLAIENSIQQMRLGTAVRRGARAYSRGLLVVGAALIRDGHDIHTFDIDCLTQDFRPDFADADVVGISAVTPSIDRAAYYASQVKACNPEAVIVVGGAHAKAMPKRTLEQYQSFDVAVYTDNPSTMSRIIEAFPDLDCVPGIAYRTKEGKVRRTLQADLSGNDMKLFPAYGLLGNDLDQYSHNIQTQSGCSFSCPYCVDSLTRTRRNAVRSVAQVPKEIAWFHSKCRQGTVLHVSDTIFNTDKRRTSTLCSGMRQYTDKLIYSIDTRSDLVDHEFARTATNCGVRYIRIGADPLQYSIVGKGCTDAKLEELRAACECIRSCSTPAVIHLYWVTGLPGSNLDTLQQERDCICRLIRDEVVDIVGNRILVPYPQTEYHMNAVDYDIQILDVPWSNYDRLSMPVYGLNSLSASLLYRTFIETEKCQLATYRQVVPAAKKNLCSVEGYLKAAYVSGCYTSEKEHQGGS